MERHPRPKLSGFTGKYKSGVKGLHHAAYRCRNTEETRKFYEDFIGLKMTEALHLKLDDGSHVLHSFFQLDDGSALAFFDVPSRPFDFKEQSDFDVHIAFEVDMETLERYMKKAKEHNVEFRGPSDHGFIYSIYFRDPNGYVFELTAQDTSKGNHFENSDSEAHKVLAGFMAEAHGEGDAKAIIHEDTWQKRAEEKQSKL